MTKDEEIVYLKNKLKNIEENKSQTETIISKFMFPMLITRNSDRTIVYANPYAEQQYETTLDKIIGLPIDEFYVDQLQKDKILNIFKIEGKVEHLELEFKTFKGNKFTGLLSLIAIKFNGEDCYMGMVFDIDEQKRQQEELISLNKKLHILATTDSMTGISNRRYFYEISQPLLDTHKDKKTPLCGIMLDIDKFKNVNDTYGHSIGDEVIISLTDTIQKIIKSNDIFARFGGEEFAIILPNTISSEANIMAENIRKIIEELNFTTKDGQQIPYTISVGVSEMTESDDIDEILKRADLGLYKAKNDGRNRVVFY